MKAINVPTFHPIQKLTNPPQNPNFFVSFHPFTSSRIAKPLPRNTSVVITLCSATPHTQNNNTTDGNPNPNPSLQIHSNSKGLIFDLGSTESWDSLEIGSPVVKRFLSDDQERWFMWYHGRSENNPGSDSIGLAVSSNGIHWQRQPGSVMNSGEDWWAFDTMSIRPSEVMVMSSTKVRAASAVYWLYYTGFTSEEVQFGGNFGRVFKSLPGLAISQDGTNWARIEGDHHSGALFDVGSNGEWDSLFIASPHVVFHAPGDLRMYYHSFDPQENRFCIGIARSRDGLKWVKLGKIMGGGSTRGCFEQMGVLNACVVKDKKAGNYVMAYEGVAEDGRTSIGLAVSSDGLKDWRRAGDEAVLVGEEGGWDGEGVGCPCLVQMEGDGDQWRLYYRGVGKEGRTGIGLAISQGSQVTNTRFERWAGFHF